MFDIIFWKKSEYSLNTNWTFLVVLYLVCFLHFTAVFAEVWEHTGIAKTKPYRAENTSSQTITQVLNEALDATLIFIR